MYRNEIYQEFLEDVASQSFSLQLITRKTCQVGCFSDNEVVNDQTYNAPTRVFVDYKHSK